VIDKIGRRAFALTIAAIVLYVGAFVAGRDTIYYNAPGLVADEQPVRVLVAIFGDTYILASVASEKEARNLTGTYSPRTIYLRRDLELRKLNDRDGLRFHRSASFIELLPEFRISPWQRLLHLVFWSS
jgi:hypothetical protein